jgi:hypothetical protein
MKNMKPIKLDETCLEFGELLLSCEGGEENKQRETDSKGKSSRIKRNKPNLHDNEDCTNFEST